MKGILLVVCASSLACAQAQDCSTGRYVTADLFPEVEVIQAVPFGSNTGVNGSPQTLYMDVYKPVGDTEQARPVVVVAFGGSFIVGSRADVAPLCMDFAKRGYVAVANDYRVGFFLPNENTTMQAVMRGAHDMRACVRYLRRSVAESDNPYGIDTSRIIVGGVSAGAISAVHATYLDEESEIPAVLAPQSVAFGGIEGNSGNAGYSSEVMACFSFSGAIGDTAWIGPDDRPIVSLHEVADNVVPCYTAPVYVSGFPTGLTASGSHDIHVRADHQSTINCFRSYPGNGHVGYLSTDYATAMDYTARFLGELVCGAEVTCGVTTAVNEATEPVFLLGPNPTTGTLALQAERALAIDVLDASGRVLLQQRLQPGRQVVDLGSLPAGAYFIRSGASLLSRAPVFKVD